MELGTRRGIACWGSGQIGMCRDALRNRIVTRLHLSGAAAAAGATTAALPSRAACSPAGLPASRTPLRGRAITTPPAAPAPCILSAAAGGAFDRSLIHSAAWWPAGAAAPGRPPSRSGAPCRRGTALGRTVCVLCGLHSSCCYRLGGSWLRRGRCRLRLRCSRLCGPRCAAGGSASRGCAGRRSPARLPRTACGRCCGLSREARKPC